MLGEDRRSDRDLAKAELELEWTILMDAFDHWSERVEKAFAKRNLDRWSPAPLPMTNISSKDIPLANRLKVLFSADA